MSPELQGWLAGFDPERDAQLTRLCGLEGWSLKIAQGLWPRLHLTMTVEQEAAYYRRHWPFLGEAARLGREATNDRRD